MKSGGSCNSPWVGTTDEIFQWAACKWGVPDDLLRAVAVRESTWHQYDAYPSGRCVLRRGVRDVFSMATTASRLTAMPLRALAMTSNYFPLNRLIGAPLRGAGLG